MMIITTKEAFAMKTTMGEKIKDLRVERHMTTKQLAAKSINTINNLTAVVQRGVENYTAGMGMPEGYSEAMTYINETKVNEDGGERGRFGGYC